MDLSIAFLTGLTSGAISCLAVQGSLLASISDKKKDIVFFLIAKLISYTLLGFLLGLLGSSFIISATTQGIVQILIGLFMIIMAVKLLDIYPNLRYIFLSSPKQVFKFIKKQSLPFILGALTVLIPCGVTQGMMFLAISGRNPVWGALTLFFFTLGTIPIFLLIGTGISTIQKTKALKIVAAIVIFIVGLISVNSGQILRGSIHTFQNYWKALTQDVSQSQSAIISSGYQEVVILATNSGYKTDVNTLKTDIPVKLILKTENTRNCTRVFSIPSLNIFKVLPVTGRETIEFILDKPGLLVFTCSMGMYTGSFNTVK